MLSYKLFALAHDLEAAARDPVRVVSIAGRLRDHAETLLDLEREAIPPHLRGPAPAPSLADWRLAR